MKKSAKLILSALLTIFGVIPARSQNLGDLLGGNLGETIGNVLEGVFSSSKISISDMAGTWTSTGPAVCFQGDSFLQKAGGVAAAAAIETKLQPYYTQYGLTGSILEITNDGKFTLTSGKLRLTGVITQEDNAQDGVFEFHFTALGGTVSLGKVTTYVQKTTGSMDVMFDATKLKKLLSGVAKYSGIDMAKTLSGILDSYDGLCVGFKLNLTKPATAGNEVKENVDNDGGIFGTLRGVFGGKKK